MLIDQVTPLVSLVNAAGKGIVNWRRVSESDGSDRTRKAGQFDSRTVTKCWVSGAYLFFFLDAAAGKGSGMRKVKLETVTKLEPIAA